MEDGKKICDLDGNALCIVGKDFINIQESDCVFIELNEKQIAEIKNLKSISERKDSEMHLRSNLRNFVLENKDIIAGADDRTNVLYNSGEIGRRIQKFIESGGNYDK